MPTALTQSAIDLLHNLGYAGLAVGLIVDSAGIPIPSEILISGSAILAEQGKFNIALVIVIGTIAQTVGAIIAYFFGAKGGMPFLLRYGKYFLISHKDLTRTHRQFEHHGQALTFVGRCLPVIRGYVGFVAGIAEMPLRRFIVASVLGSFAWTLILVGLGYSLAGHVERIDSIMRPAGNVILVILALAVGVFVYRRMKERAR